MKNYSYNDLEIPLEYSIINNNFDMFKYLFNRIQPKIVMSEEYDDILRYIFSLAGHYNNNMIISYL